MEHSSDPNGGTGIIGDGNFLYTGPYFPEGGAAYVSAPESNLTAWTPFNHTVSSGPYEMVFDPVNRLIEIAPSSRR